MSVLYSSSCADLLGSCKYFNKQQILLYYPPSFEKFTLVKQVRTFYFENQ